MEESKLNEAIAKLNEIKSQKVLVNDLEMALKVVQETYEGHSSYLKIRTSHADTWVGINPNPKNLIEPFQLLLYKETEKLKALKLEFKNL